MFVSLTILSLAKAYQDDQSSSSDQEESNWLDVSHNYINTNFTIQTYFSKDPLTRTRLSAVKGLLKSTVTTEKTTVKDKYFKPVLDQKFLYACGYEKDSKFQIDNAISKVYVVLTASNTITNTRSDCDNMFRSNAGKIFTFMAKMSDGTTLKLENAFRESSSTKKNTHLLYSFDKEKFDKITNIYIAQVGGFQKMDYVVDDTSKKITASPQSDILITQGSTDVILGQDNYDMIQQKYFDGKSSFDFKTDQQMVHELLDVMSGQKKIHEKHSITREEISLMGITYADLKINNQIEQQDYLVEFNNVSCTGVDINMMSFFRNATASFCNLLDSSGEFGAYSGKYFSGSSGCTGRHMGPSFFNTTVFADSHKQNYVSSPHGACLISTIARCYGYNVMRGISVEELEHDLEAACIHSQAHSSSNDKETSDKKKKEEEAKKKKEAEKKKPQPKKDENSFFEQYRTSIIVVTVIAVGAAAVTIGYSFL